MARKKVKKDKIPPPTTKERVKEDVETKKIITYLSNNTKNRWIPNINDTKRQEFLKDKRCELLYVGVDNDILYYYYNIKK